MDPLTRAANIEDCACRWRAAAARHTGRARAWRLARAEKLLNLAWAIVNDALAASPPVA